MVIDVRLSENSFREFTRFDLLRRRRTWLPTVRIALAVLVLAAVCAIKWLDVGALLLIIALALPTLYFYNFYRSLEKQVQKLGLKEAKYAYTLTLSDQLEVSDGSQSKRYRWKNIHCAYRDKTAVYLYITPTQAFILPTDCLPEQDQNALWTLLTHRLPGDKQTVL